MLLGVAGGASGQRSALSPAVQTAASVAHRSVRRTAVFRELRGETVGGVSVSVRGSAGRGWRRDVGLMPCQCA
jgi:hypothetical protein